MAPTTVDAVSVPRGGTRTGAPPLRNVPEEIRLDELEATNARLLRLVGELLVVNQQLREQYTACQQHAGEVK